MKRRFVGVGLDKRVLRRVGGNECPVKSVHVIPDGTTRLQRWCQSSNPMRGDVLLV